MTITIDDFLGGKIKLAQEKEGYRVTSDAVLLASAVQVKENETVLDVGTGNGVVLFCLAARQKNLQMTGMDIQPDLIKLAQENNRINDKDINFVIDDVLAKKGIIHGLQFHHVVTNPPFYREGCARLNEQQKVAFHESIPLEKWIRFCLKHIRAGGTFTMIHQMTALPDILSCLKQTKLGGVEVIPLVKDSISPAKRVIVRGILGSKKPFLLRNPFVLHKENERDYTAKAEQILRHGVALDDVL